MEVGSMEFGDMDEEDAALVMETIFGDTPSSHFLGCRQDRNVR